MIKYPKLQEALAAIVSAQHHSFLHHQECKSRCATCRALAEDEHELAETAQVAYAEELLPDLFGGEWVYSRRGEPSWGLSGGLFDHPYTFRRKGARGPTTRTNSILLAHPYKGAVDSVYNHNEINEQLAALECEGIRVWISDNLSSWVPESTYLVIAGVGLDVVRGDGFKEFTAKVLSKTADLS